MARSRRDPWKLVEQTIDAKYRVLEVIGEGGFSVVYKAEHLLWRQPVALKCLKVPPEHQARSSDLLDAFLREGRLMAALSTQSTTIVQARDVGTLTTPSVAAFGVLVTQKVGPFVLRREFAAPDA